MEDDWGGFLLFIFKIGGLIEDIIVDNGNVF